MDWLSALVGVGTALVGAKVARDANNSALNVAQTGQQQATAAVTAGNERAQNRLDYLVQQGQPGVDYLRNLTTADPNTLTPAQQLQLQDEQRQSVNRLATSGLAGSGRTVTSAIRQVNEGGRGQMVAANQARTDAAARTLAGVSAGGVGQQANLDASTGQTIGSGINTSATNSADATLASAGVNARTLSAIGSIFAGDAQDQARENRYGKFKAAA